MRCPQCKGRNIQVLVKVWGHTKNDGEILTFNSEITPTKRLRDDLPARCENCEVEGTVLTFREGEGV